MSQALSQTQKTNLNRASPQAVAGAAGEVLRYYLPNRRWIGARNRYQTSILKRLSDALDKGSKAPDPRPFAQYLAASSFHHCADGWSFFGRALTAQLAGDAEAARHLGYYAELRAAVGILATHGIGVFNGVHVVVATGPEARLVKGPGTHVMTWLTLPYWARTHAATATVASMVSPHGVPLDRWAAALPGAGAWRPVAEEWLATWGLDLEALALDRDSRNESSYQPSRISGRRSISAEAAAEFAVEAWTLLEPAGPSDPFSILDLQLLRRALETAFVSAGGKLDTSLSSPWGRAVDKAIGDALGDPKPPGIRDFLLRRESATRSDSPIFGHAGETRSFADSEHHLGVLSRALLLLRVCSGCVAQMCAYSGVAATDVQFWIEGLARDRGLWPASTPPDPLTLLYDDVAAGVDDLRTLTTSGPKITSYHDMRTRASDALLSVAGCERVALWSIAS